MVCGVVGLGTMDCGDIVDLGCDNLLIREGLAGRVREFHMCFSAAVHARGNNEGRVWRGDRGIAKPR